MEVTSWGEWGVCSVDCGAGDAGKEDVGLFIQISRDFTPICKIYFEWGSPNHGLDMFVSLYVISAWDFGGITLFSCSLPTGEYDMTCQFAVGNWRHTAEDKLIAGVKLHCLDTTSDVWCNPKKHQEASTATTPQIDPNCWNSCRFPLILDIGFTTSNGLG